MVLLPHNKGPLSVERAFFALAQFVSGGGVFASRRKYSTLPLGLR
jgi:hypothetical protein